MSTASNNAPPPGQYWIRGSKPKKLIPSMRRLYRFYGRYRIHLFVVICLILTSSILSIIGPGYLSSMTDSVAASIQGGTPVDMDFVTSQMYLLVAIYLVAMVLHYISSRTSWVTEEIVGDKLRLELSRKVSRISVGNIDGMRTGDIMSRFVNDTDVIRLRSTDCIVNTLNAMVTIIGTAVMMFVIEWRLAVVAVVPAILGFVAIRVLVKMSQKYFRAQSKDLGRMNTLVEETFRGLDVLKSYGALDEASRRFDDVNGSLYNTAFRSRFFSRLMPEISGLVNNLSYVMVCVVGSILILRGESSYGVLVAFIVYVRLLTQPLQRISESLGSIMEVAASCERIFEFLDVEEMEETPSNKSAFADV